MTNEQASVIRMADRIARDRPPPARPGAEEGDEAIEDIAGEMARELAADGVLVAWHDGGEPVILYADGACRPQSAEEELMRAGAAGAAQRGDEDGRWRVLDDDRAALMTTSIVAGRGRVTFTALFRRIGDTTRVRARDATRRMLPMLRPFFRLWAQRSRALARVRDLTAAVDASDVGIVLLDERGHPTFANAAAEALLAEGDGFRRSGAMLSGGKLADTLRLQSAIEHVLSGQKGLRGPSPVVALHRRERRPLLAAIVEGDSSVESTAIVYLFDPEQNLRPLLEPACKLYGLSPVETNLTCHLAAGTSLAVAAERMRVREQTARSYLKQIFLKTETNRQAELVWLMLKSSVRTAPACHASFV